MPGNDEGPNVTKENTDPSDAAPLYGRSRGRAAQWSSARPAASAESGSSGDPTAARVGGRSRSCQPDHLLTVQNGFREIGDDAVRQP
jgi:hypothetical protein